MKRLAIALLAVTGLVSLGQIASAADLPVKAPVYAPAPAPIFSWTGCHVGGNVGYGWTRNHSTEAQFGVPALDAGADTGTGIVGGGQIGCDYQLGNWVVGAQGMFDWTGIEGSHQLINSVATEQEILGFKTKWFGTLTGRIGYTVLPQALVYVKGGAAWARIDYSDDDSVHRVPYVGQASATWSGWTIGGGAEYAFQPNWSVFVEYNYVDLGSRDILFAYTCPTGCGGAIASLWTYKETHNLQTVLFGINYRFAVR